MRVICVNAGPMEGDVPSQPELVEGRAYTVLREVTGTGPNDEPIKHCYELAESDGRYCYQAERFLPLSDSEEEDVLTEMLIKHKQITV